MLTVRDLIGVLSEFPPDAGVYAYEGLRPLEDFVGLVVVQQADGARLLERVQLGMIEARE